jgi:rhodanese-related sulfurtransferase
MSKQFYLYSGLGGLFYTLYAASRYYSLSGTHLLTSEKAVEYIRKGIVTHVIDVRTELEWKMGHHPLAEHIPVSDINKKTMQNRGIFTNEGILVYCNTGQRARYASERLVQLGFKKVYYIDGTYENIE